MRHGSLSTYMNHACRCDPCRLAYNEYKREYTRRRRAETQAEVNQYKLARGCMDCGYNAHPHALDFDHVRGEKLSDVSTLVNRCAMIKAWEEIAKCDVVCANCHRIRTYNRRPMSAIMEEPSPDSRR